VKLLPLPAQLTLIKVQLRAQRTLDTCETGYKYKENPPQASRKSLQSSTYLPFKPKPVIYTRWSLCGFNKWINNPPPKSCPLHLGRHLFGSLDVHREQSLAFSLSAAGDAAHLREGGQTDGLRTRRRRLLIPSHRHPRHALALVMSHLESFNQPRESVSSPWSSQFAD